MCKESLEKDSKIDLSQALWCDLNTTEEKIKFIECGRANVTGIINESVADEVVVAFKDASFAVEAMLLLDDIKLCLSAHPDCEEGSQFFDLASLADELISKFEEYEK